MAISRSESPVAGIWPAQEVAARMVRGLGFDSTELRPLHWKPGQGTPLYYLETAGGRFVLKLATPRNGVTPLRDHLRRQEIEHQARVLEHLGTGDYRHLRAPKLIATDYRSYLLLEYLETVPHGEGDLPREELLESLLEFQTTRLSLPRSPLTEAGRHPGVLLARRLLGGLRQRIGWRRVVRALDVITGCYRAQSRLPRPVLRHNDFHYNNLMLTRDGSLYFTDFEYVALDDRWPLGDIVHFAVGTKEYGVDGGLILEYASRLRETLAFDFDLPAQLRFNLLLRVGKQILTRSAPAEVSARYERLFSEVLIDDQAFGRWLEDLERSAVGA